MNFILKNKKLRGDASFRNFFRKKKENFSSIIVFAKKEKLKNLLIYDSINKVLIKNRILAPRLYQENYRKNYIEIEDFGDITLYKILKKNSKKRFFYFKKILKILNQIQLIKDKKIKNFYKKNYLIPKYENKILIEEAKLFCDWYLIKKLSKNKTTIFKKKFQSIIKRLCKKLKLKNDTFVHRDFHVSNLMLVKDKLGVIDSQDALIGNRAYDLASLIDDVRLKTTVSFKNKVYKAFINNQKKINKKKFKNDFEILSILRNLKIIGVFTRLAIRDKKKNYLRLIPHAWDLINLRLGKNEMFRDLKLLLKENFKGKIK